MPMGKKSLYGCLFSIDKTEFKSPQLLDSEKPVSENEAGESEESKEGKEETESVANLFYNEGKSNEIYLNTPQLSQNWLFFHTNFSSPPSTPPPQST